MDSSTSSQQLSGVAVIARFYSWGHEGMGGSVTLPTARKGQGLGCEPHHPAGGSPVPLGKALQNLQAEAQLLCHKMGVKTQWVLMVVPRTQ